MLRRSITAFLLLIFSSSLSAASLWTDEKLAARPLSQSSADGVQSFKKRVITAPLTDIRRSLSLASNSLAKGSTPTFEIPMPDGVTEVFFVEESKTMTAGLAKQYPQIKTYKVRGVNDPTSSGTVDVTPNGFHGFLFTSKGIVFIDPIDGSTDRYQSYYKRDFVSANKHLAGHFSCGTSAADHSMMSHAYLKPKLLSKSTGKIKEYDLAVSTTTEYSAAVGGGDVDATQAEIITAINRVNEIYERDLAIRLLLVSGNSSLINVGGPADDIFINDDAGDLVTKNKDFIETYINVDDYDVGHIFSTGAGGLAGHEVVCVDGSKAEGATGLPGVSNLQSDVFYIDFVAHELGHQFGANHTFNGTTGSCFDNREPTTAFEPGSGTSIMAYAGICSDLFFGEDENVQANADAYFHAGSIDQIINYTTTGDGGTCGTLELATFANTAPIVGAGEDYIIPGQTAFTLTAPAATDINNDTLTYQWQQMDLGTATTSSTYGTDLGDNPLFRTFDPVATTERSIPQLSTILSGVTDKAETLPTSERVMNFRLVVRDGNGGVDHDDMTVTAKSTAGPFRITQPNDNTVLNYASTHAFEWDVANTGDGTIVNCKNVDILLSSDGGSTFSSEEPLATNTPNDGQECLSFPSKDLAQARIKIQCSDNIFFDISDQDFEINNTTGTTHASSSSCSASTAPSFSSANFAVSVSENKLDTGYIASATSTGTVSYSISGGSDASLFSLDSSTGVLLFNVAADYENPTDSGGDNVYDINVTASDGLLNSTVPVSITVTNVGEVSVPENQTDAGTISSSSPSATYSISAGVGVDSSLFTIDSVTGDLSFITAPDYESPTDVDVDNIYELIVTISDGSAATDFPVEVTVTDDTSDNVTPAPPMSGGAINFWGLLGLMLLLVMRRKTQPSDL